MNTTPPLPPGFTLDAQTSAGVPPPPAGFVLDSAQGQQPGPTITVGGKTISLPEYQALPEAQRQKLRDQIAQANPNSPGMARPDPLAPFVQGLTFGFGDEMRGAVQGGLAAAQGGNFGDTYKQTVDQSRAELDAQRRAHPIASFASEVAGAVPTSLLAGGSQLAGRGATLLGRALSGGAVGAAQGALYGAGTGEGNIQDRVPGAIAGGLTGGALSAAAPYLGNAAQKIAQRAQQGQILNQAAKVAPNASDLYSAASTMFSQADSANPVIQRGSFQRLYDGIGSSIKKMRPNQNTTPETVGVLQHVSDLMAEMAKPGSNVLADLKDIHILRQVAQGAYMSAKKPADKMMTNDIVRQIDNFVQTLKPSDIAGGVNPAQAAQSLMKGIGTWVKASKVSILEEAIRTGELAASGPENGVRNAFRAIAKNKQVFNRFNAAERQAIIDVAKGTLGSNTMKILGSIGLAHNSKLMPLLATAAIGASPAGIPAALLAVGGGTIAKKVGEKLARNTANRALGAAATEGLKIVPPVNAANAGVLEQLLRRSASPAAGQAAQGF